MVLFPVSGVIGVNGVIGFGGPGGRGHLPLFFFFMESVMEFTCQIYWNIGQLLSNCPFCLTMFEDGVKGANIEESMRPRDIAELLVERLQT
jgi:hypothetical protein